MTKAQRRKKCSRKQVLLWKNLDSWGTSPEFPEEQAKHVLCAWWLLILKRKKKGRQESVQAKKMKECYKDRQQPNQYKHQTQTPTPTHIHTCTSIFNTQTHTYTQTSNTHTQDVAHIKGDIWCWYDLHLHYHDARDVKFVNRAVWWDGFQKAKP